MQEKSIRAQSVLPNTLSATKEEVSCERIKGPEWGVRVGWGVTAG